MSRHPGEYMPSKFFLSQKGEKTFQHDENLPPLPVPDLNSTLDKYVESASVHLSPTERRQTVDIVEEFRRNEGPKLQKLLVERAKTHKNWLDEWWYSYGYLKLRMPIAPHMNVCGMGPYLHHYWPPAAGTQLQRNALASYFLLQHWQHMVNERLMVDSGRGGKEPWSMDQFKRIYSCCRIPGLEEDSIRQYFKPESEGVTPVHIVVLCNRRIYKVDVVTSKGTLCTPPQLEHILTKIKSDAMGKGPGIGLSSLTAADRTMWYHIREHLLSLSPVNGDHLEAIQSAIVTNCLIDDTPHNFEQMAQAGMLGKPGNIWFDKSYNSIWFENGTTSSNCDHAPMDAMTSINVCYYTDCKIIECKGRWNGDPGNMADVPDFTELEFIVDRKVLEAIEAAEEQYLQVARNVEIINPELSGIGKDKLKQLRLHPDTFVQVCAQYGYYKLHGKPAPTYETASTRKFYKGRTETVRSCTHEAVMFAKAMLVPHSTRAHKLQMFKQAITKHHSMMKECMNGQGIDRHLLGLKILAVENGMAIPQLFEDPAFEKSGGNGNYIMSTSFVGFTSVHGGVVPMCPNGYGFFYRIGPDRIVFFLCSWVSDEGTSAVKLFESIKECMLEVIDLVTNSAVSTM